MSEQYKPLAIVMGRPGFGKSFSIRNLDPNKTVIFNTELKPLPFRGANKFNNAYVEEPEKLLNWLIKAQTKENIETIVIDSFTGWTEGVMKESRLKFKGYDIFNNYNSAIGELFNLLKKSTKQIFLLGHEDVVTLTNGQNIIGLKVEGNVWEGKCEKEAVCVFHASMTSDGKGHNEYYLETQSDGTTNAKSPAGMFETFKIDNDLNLINEKIKEYYNDEPKKEEVVK